MSSELALRLKPGQLHVQGRKLEHHGSSAGLAIFAHIGAVDLRPRRCIAPPEYSGCQLQVSNCKYVSELAVKPPTHLSGYSCLQIQDYHIRPAIACNDFVVS